MNRLLFLVLIVLIALSLSSCGQKNPLAPENHEDWRIDFYDEITEDDTHPSVYQQKITILGPAEESTLYAFKLCTITDELSISTDQDGWLLFDNDIWTSKNELSMQFDIDGGTLENLISRVV
ncbi:MAG: lipoprotein, partial [Candidatus Cloacimonetes bacterium]|nr:lipoprotein [Candidatus Cloacimonadota bacterium]